MMAKRGRPRSPRAASASRVHIKLWLYPSDDDDLVTFFASIPPRLRAATVKQALRSGVCKDDETFADDDELLDALDSFID